MDYRCRMSFEFFSREVAKAIDELGFEGYQYAVGYQDGHRGFEAYVNVPSYTVGQPELLEHISIKAATPESAIAALRSRLSDVRARMREFLQVQSQTQENANGEA